MSTTSESPVVLLTPEQAADALGIGRWKLYDLLRQGRLRSIRIGSCRRISTAALLEFVTELEGEQTACAERSPVVSRRYGEGSVYRKGDGWEASAYINGRRRSVRGRTMHDARDRLRDLQQRAANGEPITDGRLTVGEYLTYWLSVTESTVRPTTYVRYETYVRVHAVPIIGHLRLVELKPMHLQQLYAKRLQAGLSPTTVHHLHRVLHRAFAMAERWEQVNRNVARLVTPPRVAPSKIEPLSLDEVRRFIDAARGSRFEAAFVLAVVTEFGSASYSRCDGTTSNSVMHRRSGCAAHCSGPAFS
jgi:excisionase family DNA binding protein